jgi:hypothetical protein
VPVRLASAACGERRRQALDHDTGGQGGAARQRRGERPFTNTSSTAPASVAAAAGGGVPRRARERNGSRAIGAMFVYFQSSTRVVGNPAREARLPRSRNCAGSGAPRQGAGRREVLIEIWRRSAARPPRWRCSPRSSSARCLSPDG